MHNLLLHKESPSLYGKVNRIFGSIPESIELAYTIASENGGNNEIWFSRKEGVSFNPRAARIGIVLLEGEKKTSAEILCSGILSSLLYHMESYKNIILNYHSNFKYIADYLDTLNFSKKLHPDNAKVLISLFIDKMRHMHLCSAEKEERIRKTLKEAEYYIEISEKFFPFYKPFIEHWIKRYSFI
jgi:hypothetical protein